MSRWLWIVLWCLGGGVWVAEAAAGRVTVPSPEPPGLMLANVYQRDIQLADYWVSEKLDGVRAYWDGTQLLSRGGHPIHAPAWFTEGFPALPLDGELWMGRGTFARLSGAVRRQRPEADSWRRIRFMVFDLPAEPGDFNRRLQRMRKLFEGRQSDYIALVDQSRVDSEAQLQARLQAVVAAGGEGLMLHRGTSHYRAVRSDDLLKLKTYEDGEAVVVAHMPGRGKYRGLLGSLLLELPSGQRFKVGSGFSDAERRNPPPLGSTITFKHHGTTATGLPRFATFLRRRSQ